MEYNKIKKDGYTLHLLKTNKFKTTQVSVYFRDTINKDTITRRSLLPFVMKSKTDLYTSKREISNKLSIMYGAKLSTKVVRIGKANVVSFNMNIVNDKFLKNSDDLVKDSCEFLNSIIFDHKQFDKVILEEEKKTLKLEFEQEFNNKFKHSFTRLNEEMLKGEEYALRTMGQKEEVDSISVEDIKEEYNTMLNENMIDVFVSGDLTEEQIESINSVFNFSGKKLDISYIDDETKELKEINYINEYDDLNQGKLAMGLRLDLRLDSDLRYAAQVYNSILGASGNSLLFMNVREKNSLAYSCNSSLDLTKGLLYVFAGIESSKYDIALKIIREQLEDLKNGNFDKALIETSKKSIVNNFKEALDSQPFDISRAYMAEIRNTDLSETKLIDGINAVTFENIVEVANKVVEDTVYFLSKKETK